MPLRTPASPVHGSEDLWSLVSHGPKGLRRAAELPYVGRKWSCTAVLAACLAFGTFGGSPDVSAASSKPLIERNGQGSPATERSRASESEGTALPKTPTHQAVNEGANKPPPFLQGRNCPG